MQFWCRTSILLACWVASGFAADWVRPGLNTNEMVWGLRGGLQFAVYPSGFRPPEPRGLIRLGYPILSGGGYDLVNFIAIEPVVEGRKGFSELERSRTDQARGKRLLPVDRDMETGAAGKVPVLTPGRLSRPAPGVEQLEVTFAVERFDNGAHVRLIVSQRSDAPDEVRLTVHAEPGSAPLDYCILTATMGNMARTRQLWLKDGVIRSLELYSDYRDIHFAPHTVYGLDRLLRTPAGELIVAVTTDESDPAKVHPFPDSRLWYYGGTPVTQYWKKPAQSFGQDLRVAVNARFTYWQSKKPIPGGVSYENFELRETFVDGQSFIFGITQRTPKELGLGGTDPR